MVDAPGVTISDVEPIDNPPDVATRWGSWLLLTNVVQIAQLVTTVGTLVAVACSLYVANKARQEVRIDRQLRTHPIVIFERQGEELTIRRPAFEYRIKGIDPKAVSRYFPGLDENGRVIDVEKNYGQLRNVGTGPAFSVTVTFEPHEIVIGDETFAIDEKKRQEPRYAAAFNLMPSVGNTILPGGEAKITRTPTFVYLDFEDRIASASGHVLISFTGMEGRELETRQEFRYWTGSKPNAERFVGMTFGDVVRAPTSSALEEERTAEAQTRREALTRQVQSVLKASVLRSLGR